MWFSGFFDQQKPPEKADVRVHIYDLGPALIGINKIGKAIGTGAFHAGVEVYGREWSFCPMAHEPYNTGVFCVLPKGCDGHVFKETIDMGRTSLTKSEVNRVLDTLMREWPAYTYDLLRHNCCHFSSELTQRLNVGRLPSWVTSLAGVGAMLRSVAHGRFHHRSPREKDTAKKKEVLTAIDEDGEDAEEQQPPRGRKREALHRVIQNGAEAAKAAVHRLRSKRHRGDEEGNPLQCRMPGDSAKPEAFGEGPPLRFRFDDPAKQRGVFCGWPWCCTDTVPGHQEESISSVSSAEVVLQPDDKVDVFSNSSQVWCPGYVESVDGHHVVVAFRLPGAKKEDLSMKVLDMNHPNIRRRIEESSSSRAPSRVASASSRGYAVGEQVEVFSNSAQVWCQGYVDSIVGEVLHVQFRFPGKPNEWVRKQLSIGHQNLRRAQAAPSASPDASPWATRAATAGPSSLPSKVGSGIAAVGNWVEIFSNSNQDWCVGCITHSTDSEFTVAFQLPGAEEEDEWLEKTLKQGSDMIRELR